MCVPTSWCAESTATDDHLRAREIFSEAQDTPHDSCAGFGRLTAAQRNGDLKDDDGRH